MSLKAKSLLAATAVAATSVIMLAPSADAASLYYSSCDRLHRDYKHGVAKSYTAARKQVRDGYGMPAYGTRPQGVLGELHARLDRDRDGTACEA